MAYDKVVDSAVLDAGLKQIADAIREKGGTTDTLAFPQAMADAIAAIEAGGGSPLEYYRDDNYYWKLYVAMFTPAEDCTEISLFDVLSADKDRITAGSTSYGAAFLIYGSVQNSAYIGGIALAKNLYSVGAVHSAIFYKGSYPSATDGRTYLSFDSTTGILTSTYSKPLRAGVEYTVIGTIQYDPRYD